MIYEYCPCKHHRILAVYDPASHEIAELHAKAAIRMAVPDGEGPHLAVVEQGTATCERRLCAFLRRS